MSLSPSPTLTLYLHAMRVTSRMAITTLLLLRRNLLTVTYVHAYLYTSMYIYAYSLHRNCAANTNMRLYIYNISNDNEAAIPMQLSHSRTHTCILYSSAALCALYPFLTACEISEASETATTHCYCSLSRPLFNVTHNT